MRPASADWVERRGLVAMMTEYFGFLDQVYQTMMSSGSEVVVLRCKLRSDGFRRSKWSELEAPGYDGGVGGRQPGEQAAGPSRPSVFPRD